MFVIYSLQDSTPTILYERKEPNAKIEQNILLDLLEEFENGSVKLFLCFAWSVHFATPPLFELGNCTVIDMPL